MKHVVIAGKQWSAKHGTRLSFFGHGHDEAEDDHTLWNGEILDLLRAVELEPHAREELRAVVHQAFDHFTAFIDELLAMAKSGRRLESASVSAAP